MSGVRVRAAAVAGVLFCAAAATEAPDAHQPVPIECPATLDDAATWLPTWRPPAHSPHGVHEFTHSELLALPASITSFEAELWGGGGGGGGGGGDSLVDNGAGGGGGASGGYARGAIPVLPQRHYLIIVGEGGEGGEAKKGGQRGAPSAICENGTTLLYAEGGPGGGGAASTDKIGVGGRWVEGDVDDPLLEGALQRAGHDGRRGAAPLLELRGLGGTGGEAVRGSIDPPGSFGGDGGAGAIAPDTARRGTDGGAGTVIIGW